MRTTAQQLVEHALATSTADDCIAIVRDVTSANLRWANNTLTTNGVMTEVSVTVVSFAAVEGGVATGSVSGSASTLEQVTALVERADAAARAGSPAEDAADCSADVDLAGLGHRAGDRPTSAVYDAFAPALGEAFGQATAEDRLLYGFVNHDVATTYLGVEPRARGCGTCSRPATTRAPARTPR